MLGNHYRWFDWHLSENGQNMNFGFWKKNLAQIIAYYVYFHMLYHTFIWNYCGCQRWVLNMTHFQLFDWLIQTLLLVRKMGKYLNFWFGIHLHPKTISNDQVGSCPCPYTKILEVPWGEVSLEQKMSRKTDFQYVKLGNFLKLVFWFLMMIWKVKQPISLVLHPYNFRTENSKTAHSEMSRRP